MTDTSFYVQVTGDRNWTDRVRIERALDRLAADIPWMSHGVATLVTLRHGNARGADLLFAEAAEALGWQVVPYRAEWEKYGRAAGPIRNKQMVEAQPPADIVLWAHDDIENSKGTKNMLEQCRKAGLPTRRVD